MNNHKEEQRERQVNLLKTSDTNSFLFGGARGDGTMYNSKDDTWCEYSFIIQHDDSVRNLYKDIRTYALKYFERYSIEWWNQSNDRYFPTGHLLSSQIHCLNHLFAIAKDKAAVLAIIKPIGEKIGVHFDEVLPSFIDNLEHWEKNGRKCILNNYISFEFVCQNKDLLGESFNKRGAKCTSVDAFVYARAGEEYWLIPIEWKFTEDYLKKEKVYDYARYAKYVTGNSRLKNWSRIFESDPYFELGRQTLLMEQLIANPPYYLTNDFEPQEKQLKADNFLHIVVAPNENKLFREHTENFKKELKPESQHLFSVIDPQDFLSPLKESKKSKIQNLIIYLKTRYWE